MAFFRSAWRAASILDTLIGLVEFFGGKQIAVATVSGLFSAWLGWLAALPLWRLWILFLAGLVVVLWACAVVIYFRERLGARDPTYLQSRWRSFSFLIPLDEAAEIAYEETDDSLAAGVAERPALSGDPDPRSWYATALIGRGKIPVFGRKPYQRRMRRVPVSLVNSCSVHIDEQGASLRFTISKNVVYTRLAITKKDLKARIREIGTWG